MLLNDNEYLSVVEDIKLKIRHAQYRAVLAVNCELVMLYWHIGTVINEFSIWGNKFVENLARDIKLDFPDAKGYSVRNLKYMAKFSKTYSDLEFVQRTVAQIPWRHNVALLDKVKEHDQRVWYAQKIIEDGWSRDWLVTQIENRLYERQAITQKSTNFDLRLPSPQSELVKQSMKDPYVFDFIENRDGILEREIEKEMIKNITKLLLELGTGFAFMGNQYQIMVENEEFYIDMLFYHVKLRCFIPCRGKSSCRC